MKVFKLILFLYLFFKVKKYLFLFLRTFFPKGKQTNCEVHSSFHNSLREGSFSKKPVQADFKIIHDDETP